MDVPVASPMEHSPGPAQQQYEQVQGPYLSAELNQMQFGQQSNPVSRVSNKISTSFSEGDNTYKIGSITGSLLFVYHVLKVR